MLAIVSAKNAFLRSDGLFFVTADTIDGAIQRGDILTVPLENSPPFRAPIDLVIFIANDHGNQQSLVFKNLDKSTIESLKHAIDPGLSLTIERNSE